MSLNIRSAWLGLGKNPSSDYRIHFNLPEVSGADVLIFAERWQSGRMHRTRNAA